MRFSLLFALTGLCFFTQSKTFAQAATHAVTIASAGAPKSEGAPKVTSSHADQFQKTKLARLGYYEGFLSKTIISRQCMQIPRPAGLAKTCVDHDKALAHLVTALQNVKTCMAAAQTAVELEKCQPLLAK